MPAFMIKSLPIKKSLQNNVYSLLQLNKFFVVLLLFSISILLNSCTKDEELLGLDVQPNGQRLNTEFTDTLTLVAYTVLDDSLTTNRYASNLLGSIYDPIFGTTTASFFTQFRTTSNDISFGTNAGADSLVLTLQYKGSYGDTSASQTIKVFEVTEDMNFDSTYLSNRYMQVNSSSLAEKTFIATPKDSVSVYGKKVSPHLRININNPTFLAKIMNTSNLITTETFLANMKGLYVTGDKNNTGGSILYFALESTFSKLTLYYHNDANDSLQVNFAINDKCARYNNFEHYGYANASTEFRNQVINKDTTLGQSKLYLQSMGGTMIKLKIPHLKDLIKTKKIAVNEAALILTNDDNTFDMLPPSQLGLFKFDSKNQLQMLSYDIMAGSSYYGGSYNKSNGSYKFRLTRHIQRLLNGNEADYGLAIITDERRTSSNRVLIKGSSQGLHGTQRLKLLITYTKVE